MPGSPASSIDAALLHARAVTLNLLHYSPEAVRGVDVWRVDAGDVARIAFDGLALGREAHAPRVGVVPPAKNGSHEAGAESRGRPRAHVSARRRARSPDAISVVRVVARVCETCAGWWWRVSGIVRSEPDTQADELGSSFAGQVCPTHSSGT